MLPSSLSSVVFASVVAAAALALAFFVLGIGTLTSSAYSLRRALILFTASLWLAGFIPALLVPTTPRPLDALLDNLPRHAHETVCRGYVDSDFPPRSRNEIADASVRTSTILFAG